MSLRMSKNGRNSGFVDDVDRISCLPDEILVKILSYLATNEAISTSILSKRWEYLWTSVIDLEFSDRLIPYMLENDCAIKSASFKEYVDRVLFYNDSPFLRRCSMYFGNKYVSPNIYSWICAVLTRNVRELDLVDDSFIVQQLPPRLFTCSTLVVLKICGSFVIDLPAYVLLPCLKVLRLSDAIFVDDASTQKLFSSCPVLEELTIKRRRDLVKIMKISVPSLKILCILNRVNDRTVIDTPLLQYFLLKGRKLCRYSMNLLPSLFKASLGGGFDICVLKGISQVKHLNLHGEFMSDLGAILEDYALPTFINLKQIELHVGDPIDWKLLPFLLNSSPNLEVLLFPKGLLTESENGFYNFSWPPVETTPEPVLLRLKTVKIFNFVGLENELRLVEYLLRHAKVLEKMIIHSFDFRKKPSASRLEKLREANISEISNFKRCLATCEVYFAV